MKMMAFNVREDERDFFLKYAKKYGLELEITPLIATEENAAMAKGCDCISTITTGKVTEDILKIWKACGVHTVSTRSIGFDHIDLDAAKRLNITISNVSYSSASVADYAVMMLLMACRKMNLVMKRYIGQDYSLSGVRGKDLCSMTVGVVGTGKIGEEVIKRLKGFGCKVLAYSVHQKESVKENADYVSLKELFAKCDAITLHTAATRATYHMVNRDTLKMMKDGVILVNTARGSVIDSEALIEGLESGKVGAAALDVVDNEMTVYYRDMKGCVTGHRDMAILSSMPNVIMTPHTAFFTDQAISDMVENSIKGCLAELNGTENPWKVC